MNSTSDTAPAVKPKSTLRNFTEEHIGEDCSSVTGRHTNALYFECEFKKLNGLTLEQCDLNRSKFTPATLRDALNFTVTLNCFSFKNVELNDIAFDSILMLLTLTKGNDDKRRTLAEVIGLERYTQLLRIAKVLE
jgi:hypothetical protein